MKNRKLNVYLHNFYILSGKIIGISIFIFMFTTLTIWISGVDAAKSLGDPFDGNSLQNNNWKWKASNVEGAEPNEWDVGNTKEGWLHITGEVNRNLWPSDTTNRLYQVPEGDFDVETHVYINYTGGCVVSGLTAYSPTTKDRQNRDGEWVTIKLWGRQNDAIIQWQKRQFDGGEGLRGHVPGFQDPAGEMDIYMRLSREGNTFNAWWKREANEDWIHIGETEQEFNEPLEVGIYSGICTGSGTLTTQFEYFVDNLTPSDVSPRAKLPIAWGALKQRHSLPSSR